MSLALQESLADYGSLYLIILGTVAIVMTVLPPRGRWGLLTGHRQAALFSIQRRLVVGRAGPMAAEPVAEAAADPPGRD